METFFKNNVLIDRKYSEIDNENDESDFILDAVNTNVKRRNIALLELSSDVQSEEEHVEDPELPFTDIYFPNFQEENYIFLRDYISETQNWIGHIIEIGTLTFKAKLEDVSNPGTFEIGEFELKEVTPEDLDYFKLGSVFYWSLGIGFIKGQRTKQSLIRFQRLNNWSAQDYDESEDRADEYFNYLNNEKG